MWDKSLLQKEWTGGLRTHRFLILGAVFLFFAVFTPFMNRYALPALLAQQFPGMPAETMEAMLVSTQRANIRGYLGDLFELGSLAVAFTLAGLMAGELRARTLVFSVTSNKRFCAIVTAKFIVYGGFMLVLSVVSVFANWFYAGLLYSFEITSLAAVLRAGLLQGAFFVHVVAALLLFGSLIARPIPVGLIGLGVMYAPLFLGGLFHIERFLPTALLTEAQNLTWVSSGAFLPGAVTAAGLTVLCLLCAVWALSGRELARGA